MQDVETHLKSKCLSQTLNKKYACLGKPQKKVLLLMAGPLRPNPLPRRASWPWKFWNIGKKRFQKSYFFLNGPALYPLPSPLLMAWPLREELFILGFP